jgi:hypothetical protein
MRTLDFSSFDFHLHFLSRRKHALFRNKPSETAIIGHSLKKPSRAFHRFPAPRCRFYILKKSSRLISKAQTVRHDILLYILMPAVTFSNLDVMTA